MHEPMLVHRDLSARDQATGQASGKTATSSSNSASSTTRVATGDVDGDGRADVTAVKNSGHATEKNAVLHSSSSVQSPRDAASGQASGKRQHKPVTVTKELDKASTKSGVAGEYEKRPRSRERGFSPWVQHRVVFGTMDLITAAGILLASVSFALASLSRVQLGKSFAFAPQAKGLVTHGLYSRIRNPMYLFMDLTVVGLTLATHFWYLACILLVLVRCKSAMPVRNSNYCRRNSGRCI